MPRSSKGKNKANTQHKSGRKKPEQKESGRKESGRKESERKSTGRFKTGLIFSAAVLLCLLLSDISTVILATVLTAFCAFEFFALLRSDAKLPNEWIGLVGAALYPLSYVWIGIKGMLLLTVILTVVSMIWHVAYPKARITDVAVTVFGALYTGFMLSSIVIIRMGIEGFWGGLLAVGVVFSVWANDTMAYVWGSRLGRNRMAPRISPKKSWEGCVAGLIGSVIIWLAFPFIPGVSLSFVAAAICGFITGVFSVLGDLAESRVKRAAGKKDSGVLLPGHGGFLDRCDALIMGSAASALCLIIVGVIAI